MPDAVEEVIDERPRDDGLEGTLGEDAEAGEGLNEGRGLDVPAEERGGEVDDAVAVEGTGEGASGDTGPDGGTEPGLLGAVDLEVGGDGADLALGDEEGFFLVGGELLGHDGGAGEGRVSTIDLFAFWGKRVIYRDGVEVER